MIKLKPFQSFALVLLAGVLIGAAADRAISRTDVRSMSKAAKNRQIRRDMLSIMLPSESLYSSNRINLEGDAFQFTVFFKRGDEFAQIVICHKMRLG